MCLDKLRRVRKNYKKHLAGHFFQCRSKNLCSEGRGKAVITGYNGLLKNSFFFLKEVISSYNMLQRATMRYKMLQKQCSQRTIT